MAELLGLAAGQGGEAPFSSTPLLWFVLKNLPRTGVNETTGKVGKAPNHSSTVLLSHRCFLPSPPSTAASETSGISSKLICGSQILFQGQFQANHH